MDESRGLLNAVEGMTSTIRLAERQLDALVVQAREAGATWTALGAALGTTRQGAKWRHDAALQRLTTKGDDAS